MRIKIMRMREGFSILLLDGAGEAHGLSTWLVEL
jgi:hypothetical protein